MSPRRTWISWPRPDAAGPVTRGHRPFVLRLHVAEPDGAATACEDAEVEAGATAAADLPDSGATGTEPALCATARP